MKLAANVLRFTIAKYKAAKTDEERVDIALKFMAHNAQVVLEEIENHHCKEADQ